MSVNSITAEFAKQLLATFKNPVSAKSENHDLGGIIKGGFISNNDFLDQPHCCGAYCGTGDDQEFYLEWSGFDGIDDCHLHFNTAYSFQEIENASNYMDCIRIVKIHLSKIVNDEL